MHKIITVTKNELIRYFVSPLAYVYLFCFVLLNASFATYFGDFFDRGVADLQSLFMFQPWLYLLFIPGISMRLWAEEFHSKTIVQLVTQPISITQLVLGKFLAAWLFCGLALMLTFPFWLTINALGQPDNFAIFIGYCGSFLLAGAMLAVSQTMSALTKNQIIALVLAVIANLLFFWSGIEYVLAFCRIFMPATLVDVVASFSFLTHFDNITYGLVELRDIIFFGSLIVFCLFTTILILNVKTAGNSGWLNSGNKAYNIFAWLMLLIMFFSVNVLANSWTANIQYDATAEKNYTLTESTRNILKKLPEPVLAKLYFSPILEQRNPELREQFNKIRILLHKYKSASQGKFDYKIYYPKFLDREEDIAISDGLQPIPLIDLNQTALFGLTVEDTLQSKEVIPFFAQAQYGRLEQDITTKIYELNHQPKTMGIISSLPLFGQSSLGGQMIMSDPWQIISLLEKNYKLHQILEPADFDKHQPDVLLLLYPRDLSKEMIEKIKQYSRNNGKIILVLDPANEASRLYAPATGRLEASDIGELEQFWRIKLYPHYVVADLQNSVTVDATTDYAKNPVFSQDVIQFKIRHQDMNPAHPVTQNLHEIMFASASIVMPNMDAYNEKRIIFYPLLRAGEISELVSANAVADGVNPQELLKDFATDGNQKILAAEVIGLEDDRKFDLIVVTDSDFLYDSFWMEKVHLLESEYVTAVFDNANFLLNAADYLTGNTALLGLRGKRAQDRNFGGIEILRRLNALQYKQEENRIFEEINVAKRGIQGVWAKKEVENRENFTPDELAAISKIRRQLDDFRQRLSELRFQANHKISIIGTRIAFLNIWLLPLIFVMVVLCLLLWRIIKRRNSWCLSFGFNRKLLILSIGALLLTLMSVLSVFAVNRSSIDVYDNKLVFPQFAEQLNSVDTVILKTNKQQLTFELKDGIWNLKEVPYLPVYQERIRRLLTTVADARYFARKSNKAENLAMFNLLPIEDENSDVIKLTFKNAEQDVLSFNLGDINIDIGRGQKAAYIRQDNQFQVWEINADFVSMDLDWHNWTYSHLWDLRFGRPTVDSDNPYREEYLASLMRMLLNTPYQEIIENPQIPAQAAIRFNIEGGDTVELSLHQKERLSYAVYSFGAQNKNPHLKMLEQYLNGKACVIENDKMEKLLDVIK
ncbi:MAG: Gldg family protein [Alphaproteobacteria bacterium]|nr:Gldg family protein [Alphaproteobacteria bacterium]